MFLFLIRMHPAIRLVIGGAVVASGVFTHREVIILVGGVVAVIGAIQWLVRARGSRQ
jgi:hypothetical protein